MTHDLIRMLERAARQRAAEQWNRTVNDAVLYGIYHDDDGTQIIEARFNTIPVAPDDHDWGDEDTGSR